MTPEQKIKGKDLRQEFFKAFELLTELRKHYLYKEPRDNKFINKLWVRVCEYLGADEDVKAELKNSDPSFFDSNSRTLSAPTTVTASPLRRCGASAVPRLPQSVQRTHVVRFSPFTRSSTATENSHTSSLPAWRTCASAPSRPATVAEIMMPPFASFRFASTA